MKTKKSKLIVIVFAVLFFCGIAPIHAQDEVEDYGTISGIVKDQKTKKALPYVNLSISGTNIGTITNEDGEFSLKVKESVSNRMIQVSHLGYLNSLIPYEGKDASELTVWMTPNSNLLDEIVIRGRNPKEIVEEAIAKISVNYSPNSNLFTGFYRETAQKGRRYINISEAVIDIYKTPYKDMNVNSDRVQIYKGRKLLSQRASDTLIVKLLGGPNLSVFVDIVKNPDILLDPQTLPYYSFKMEESVMLNDRPHYVISFQPAAILNYALYYGTLYIDKEKMSFTRAEFNLSMDDRNKATEAILKRKPYGLRFKPQEVSFLVTYHERDGISYLSYIRNTVRFSCDWKRRLFATNYTVNSEMVVTDGKIADNKISYRESFKSNQSLYDKVSDFTDDDFWGSYNIIEPTESLESAVTKLKKQRN